MHRAAYVFVGSLVLIAVLAVALRLFLPGMAAAYKSEIVAHLSETLGVDIRVGDMQVALRGIQPEFTLLQVEIDAPESSVEPVRVEELRVEFDLLDSLLGWRIDVSDLYIAGTDFLVVTDEAGDFRISGFLPVRFPSSDVLTQSVIPEIVFHLERGGVRWRNEQAGVDYEFENVHAGFEYRRRRLKVFLDSRLPEPLGRRLRLSVDLEGVDAPDIPGLRGGDWSGQFYLDVGDADMKRWARLTGGPDSVAGVLTAELRGDFQGGELQRLEGSVACDACNVVSHVARDAVSLRTSLLWMTDADGWVLEIPAFSGEVSGIGIRGASAAVDYGEEGSQVALQVPALNVAKAATVAAGLGWLDADDIVILGGRGGISWSGFVTHPPLADLPATPTELPPGGTRFLADGIDFLARRAAAHFRHLFTPPEGVSSGVEAATVRLDLEALSVRTPGWSQRVFDLDAVGMDVHYRGEPRRLRIDNLSLRLNDTRLSGEIVWPSGQPQTVSARLSVENLALASIRDLLPERGLWPKLRRWLDNAFIAGVMDKGRIELDGALSSFPFNDGSGKFSARGEFRNAELNYRAGRQPLRNLDGHVVFDNEKLVVEATRVSYYDWDFHSARAALNDIMKPHVEVDAAGEGPLSGIFSYLGDEGLLDPESIVVRNLDVEGNGRIDLAVSVPLGAKPEQPLSVEGTLDFGGNALRIVPLNMRFDEIEGTLYFDREGGSAQSLKANFNGAEVTGRAETASGGTRLVLGARLPATRLFDWVAPPRGALRGMSLWHGEFLIPKLRAGAEYQLEVALRSSLVGTEVALPSPLGKASDRVRDFSVAMEIDDSGSRYDVSYGADIDARLVQGGGEHSRRSGYLHFGQDDPPPFVAGLFRIDGEIAQPVDLAEWFDLMSDREGAAGYFDYVTLSFAELRKGGEVLGKTALSVEVGEGGRRFEVDAPWMSGWGIWPDVADRDAFVKLDRLFLPKRESTAATTFDPRDFPSVELEIADFRWGDARLSDLQLLAESSGTGLRIGRLGFRSEGVLVSSRGSWSLQGGRHATQLNFSARSKNYGKSLRLLNLSDNFKGGDGEIRGGIEWGAWPGGVRLAMLEGDISVKLADGVIEKADPSIGRLFGLFSTGHIVRRLSLDFSDVVEKGLAYDRISGNFHFHGGVMHTEDLIIEGPALSMKIQGDSDTVRKRYDQHIDVVPNFSSSLPVTGALLGGPIAGAVVYLLDKLTDVGSKVDEILTLRYHLHGPWEDPQIDFKGVPGARKGTQRAKDVLRKIIRFLDCQTPRKQSA